METNKKINFWKVSSTILLISLVLVLVFQISYAWTNPTVNPSSGAGAISVSSGNVGIGIASPGAKLEVVNSSSNSFKAGNGTSYFYVNQYGTGAFVIPVNSANYAAFGVLGPSDTYARFTMGLDTGVPFLGFGPGTAARDVFIRRDSGNLVFTFGTTPSEKMRITSAGLVGIGATSPDSNYKLTVGSQTTANSGAKIETTSATNPAIYVANAGGGAAIKIDSGKGVITAQGGFVTETRTSDPSSPVAGQIWLRTDL